jgi:hypothetical protein
MYRPAFAAVLLVHLFAIEQVLQSIAPFLRSTPIGNQLLNYVVAGVTAVAATVYLKRKPDAIQGLFNPTLLVITALLAWSVITVSWSPGRDAGLQMLLIRWPYYFVVVVLGSFLIGDTDDLLEFLQGLIIVGAALCGFILVSPEFESQYGRLGIVEGGKMASNPLALGELGGVVVVCGALLRRSNFGSFGVPIRLIALGVGIATAVKSGSRGQLLFSTAVATVAFPFVARVRNVSGFILSVAGAGAIVLAVVFLGSTLLEGFAAKRFTVDSLLYGSSSTAERASNVVELAKAWASSPVGPLIGLGYYSFSSLGLGIDYSHVVAADMLFELGLPGAALYVTLLVLGFRSCRELFRRSGDDDLQRAVSGTFVALIAFYFLLSNKQGDLWGIVTLFMLASVAHRVRARQSLQQMEPPPMGGEFA